MFDPLEDPAPTLNDLQALATLAKFNLEAKACLKRSEELIGLTIAHDEAKAAAEKAQAALAAAMAEHEAASAERTAALDEREKEYEAMNERWVERNKQLDARERSLSDEGREQLFAKEIERCRQRDAHTRRQVMRLSHLDVNYNSVLQSFPDWDQILGALLDGADAHDIDGDQHMGEDAAFAADHALPPEPGASHVAGKRAPRNGAERRAR